MHAPVSSRSRRRGAARPSAICAGAWGAGGSIVGEASYLGRAANAALRHVEAPPQSIGRIVAVGGRAGMVVGAKEDREDGEEWFEWLEGSS